LLPFGAATLGNKADVNALQKAVVFLSGPALGLIAGTICLVVGLRSEIDPLVFCGTFFLILNYIILIPVVPLDGGRLFEAALFSRAPVMKSVFLVISLLTMALAAILLKDPILIFFSIFMVIGARTQILINSAHSEIKKQIKNRQLRPDKESILPEIFRLLKKKAFARLPFAKKYEVSKSLVSELTQKPAGLAEAIVSLILYLMVFAIPMLIAIPAVMFFVIRDGT
jgi:membrane-associated protease RseP (regulator of RpoE activity)